MTAREKLVAGLSRVAWGYVLLYVNIHLGGVNILPSFVGYLLLYGALDLLAEERRELKLLRPLAVLLAVWKGAEWALACLGMTMNVPFLGLLAAAVSVYFDFQLLTDLAAIAETWDPSRIGSLRACRNILAVGGTLGGLLPYLSDGPLRTVALVLLTFAVLTTMLCLLVCLFGLRRAVRDCEVPEQE